MTNIVSMYKVDRLSIGLISLRTGMSRDEIESILITEGIKLRGRRGNRISITKEELKNLYIEQNLPLAEVARMIDASVSTMFHRLSEFGIEKSPEDKKSSQLEAVRKGVMAKYGVEYPLQSRDVQELAANTVKERYGVDNVFQLEEVKERSKQTHLSKRGVEHHQSTDEFRAMARKNFQARNLREATSIGKTVLSTPEEFKRFIQDRVEDDSRTISGSVYDLADELGVHVNSVRRRLSGLDLDQQIRISKNEHMALSTLRQLGIDNNRNDRTVAAPKEIDFFLPSHGVGIEINPLYTHSYWCERSAFTKKFGYHLEKIEHFLAARISVYSVWGENPELTEDLALMICRDNYVTHMGGKVFADQTSAHIVNTLLEDGYKLEPMSFEQKQGEIRFLVERPVIEIPTDLVYQMKVLHEVISLDPELA